MLKRVCGISLGSFIATSGIASNTEEQSSSNKRIKADILVVGGGTAGVIAAIQAARAGCHTILVENGSQLGGTMTTGGVAFPGLFHAWGKQVVAGIGWELVFEAAHLGNNAIPDFNVPTGRWHWKHQINLNPFLYALLAEEKCLEAGVDIRYYETPVKAVFKRNVWEVDVMGKGCNTRIQANQVIDCTGNAFVAALAGFKVLREEETQPGSLRFRIDGYDIRNLDTKLIQTKYDEAVKNGQLSRTEFKNIIGFLQDKGNSAIMGADSTTSETHTLTNIKGRSSLMKMLRFLRTLPGCEKVNLVSMQPETAVRETYRIDGEYQITHEDYISGKVHKDSLSYSFYPIDLHDKNGVVPKHLRENIVATVPLRALIPKKSRNFLVAGRCISSDRLANSALRVQASCMGMAQAAAIAAVIASKKGVSPLQVDSNEIKDLLRKYEAIIPE